MKKFKEIANYILYFVCAITGIMAVNNSAYFMLFIICIALSLLAIYVMRKFIPHVEETPYKLGKELTMQDFNLDIMHYQEFLHKAYFDIIKSQNRILKVRVQNMGLNEEPLHKFSCLRTEGEDRYYYEDKVIVIFSLISGEDTWSLGVRYSE